MEVGEDHDLDVAGAEALGAQLGGHVLARLEREVLGGQAGPCCRAGRWRSRDAGRCRPGSRRRWGGAPGRRGRAGPRSRCGRRRSRAPSGPRTSPPSHSKNAGRLNRRGRPPSARPRPSRPPARRRGARRAGSRSAPHLHGASLVAAADRERRSYAPARWRTPSRIFAPGLLEGQVCVVSGAGTGLGRATALELAGWARPWSAAAAARSRWPEMVEAGDAAGGRPSPSRWTSARRRPWTAIDGVVERHGRHRPAGQQRRRPVPEPGRGDHPEGLPHRDRPQRAGHLADDPRRRDQGLHPPGGGQGRQRHASRPTWASRAWSTPAPPGRRSRT